MARSTPLETRSLLIYQVDPRTFGPTGKLSEIESHLDRIRALGADIVYVMPFSPIGVKGRQGPYGSSYCIRDHRAVSPELGTLEDVRKLGEAVRRRGMRFMIDMVLNHGAQDHVYFTEHPEWATWNADGTPRRKIQEWVDAVDFDFTQPGLWEAMQGTLEHWARLGVDGFRCDVAAMVPLDFWREARARVEAIRPGVVWLAESSSPGGVLRLRDNGHASSSDAELYEVFDICYDYDIHHHLRQYFAGEAELEVWLEDLRRQRYTYPQNYAKLRFLENHDLERFALVAKSREQLVQWTALMFFLQGPMMIFAGEELVSRVRMDSGEIIPHLDWTVRDPGYLELVRGLATLKKEEIFSRGVFRVRDSGRRGVVWVSYEWNGRWLHGVFNVGGRHGTVKLGLPDGTLVNRLGGEVVRISGGELKLGVEPVIIGGQG